MHPKIIEKPVENLIPREAEKAREMSDSPNAATRESFVRVIKFRGSRGSVLELIFDEKLRKSELKSVKNRCKIDEQIIKERERKRGRKNDEQMMPKLTQMEQKLSPKCSKKQLKTHGKKH